MRCEARNCASVKSPSRFRLLDDAVPKLGCGYFRLVGRLLRLLFGTGGGSMLVLAELPLPGRLSRPSMLEVLVVLVNSFCLRVLLDNSRTEFAKIFLRSFPFRKRPSFQAVFFHFLKYLFDSITTRISPRRVSFSKFQSSSWYH